MSFIRVVSFFIFLLVSSCKQAEADLVLQGYGRDPGVKNVVFRSSSREPVSSKSLFVAVDFLVPIGEHMYAPLGKGLPLAPKITWANAETIEAYWPEHKEITETDGTKSGYFGYSKDFTLLLEIRVLDPSKPVEYKLSYVSCGESCVPVTCSGTLEYNGLLLADEITRYTGPSEMTLYDFLIALLMGLLGGLILNCMPCVFPIISIKIFSILKTAGNSQKSARKHGMAVSLGTILTFLTLGVVLLVLRSTLSDTSQAHLGWGFYMQNPQFVFVLLLVFLLCALHFFGILHVKLPTPTKQVIHRFKGEYASSFFSGVFGAFSSAACVGPFAGIAVASALLQGSPLQSGCIFTFLGIGASLPFLLLSLIPRFVKILPKPGKWLAVFKEFMGFTMLFSCVWPIWTLTTQIAPETVMLIIMSLIGIAMFAWMLGHSKSNKIALTIALGGIVLSASFGLFLSRDADKEPSGIVWAKYSDKMFDDAIHDHKPVFLNFTASWCMNCQFNQRLFNDKKIIEAFKRRGVITMKCDWSKGDENVTRLLRKYGAASVPLYVFYQSNSPDFKILSNILTKEEILETVNGTK
ncbi:MAG: thioredoxin family protein [Holosporales bacterium]|jgi:thiol:disulfide interchange protein|nr:thioredoxin family protein [Holosporales bacterium]